MMQSYKEELHSKGMVFLEVIQGTYFQGYELTLFPIFLKYLWNQFYPDLRKLILFLVNAQLFHLIFDELFFE